MTAGHHGGSLGRRQGGGYARCAVRLRPLIVRAPSQHDPPLRVLGLVLLPVAGRISYRTQDMKLALTASLFLLVAGSEVGATPRTVGPIVTVVPGAPSFHRPLATKKAKHTRRPAAAPAKPHPRGDFERKPAVVAAGGSCEILRASDPEDDMAYALWAAHIDSPRH